MVNCLPSAVTAEGNGWSPSVKPRTASARIAFPYHDKKTYRRILPTNPVRRILTTKPAGSIFLGSVVRARGVGRQLFVLVHRRRGDVEYFANDPHQLTPENQQKSHRGREHGCHR